MLWLHPIKILLCQKTVSWTLLCPKNQDSFQKISFFHNNHRMRSNDCHRLQPVRAAICGKALFSEFHAPVQDLLVAHFLCANMELQRHINELKKCILWQSILTKSGEKRGTYLNSPVAYDLHENESKKTYFADKISILEELFPLVEEGNHYICITRPRRFGKTVTANLIASFFSKGCDASDVFDRLKVSGNQEYRRKMNQYNVIHISLNEVLCDL